MSTEAIWACKRAVVKLSSAFELCRNVAWPREFFTSTQHDSVAAMQNVVAVSHSWDVEADGVRGVTPEQ